MGGRHQSSDTLPHLRAGERIDQGLRRVLDACLALAARDISNDLHLTRVALKRARALLRLGQDLGVSRAGSLRRRLSALNRRLGDARDREAAAVLVVHLCPRLDPASRPATRRFAAKLRAQSARIDCEGWSKELRTLRESCRRRSFAAITRKTLLGALARSARRVRRRTKDLRDATDLHALRKAAATLRHQSLAAAPQLDRTAAAVAEKLGPLTRHLGRFRDWRRLRRWCPRTLGELRALAKRKETKARRKACHVMRALRAELRAFEACAG